MDVLNHILCVLFDFVSYPFDTFHPLWGLVTISVLTGIFMLIVFRFTSNQTAIRNVKERIKAHFLEIRLYKNDLGLMLKAQKNILKYNFFYMKYSIKPMLFLMVPVVLIMIQLSVRFDRSPLNIGESAIVKLKFKDQASFKETVVLKVPAGVYIETPPLRVRENKEIDWRIKALHKGIYHLKFELNQDEFRKRLVIDDRVAKLSARKASLSFWQLFLYPVEKSFPADSQIEYIEIRYPPISYRIFGWNIHWLVIFFIVSIGTGFGLKKFFKVDI